MKFPKGINIGSIPQYFLLILLWDFFFFSSFLLCRRTSVSNPLYGFNHFTHYPKKKHNSNPFWSRIISIGYVSLWLFKRATESNLVDVTSPLHSRMRNNLNLLDSEVIFTRTIYLIVFLFVFSSMLLNDKVFTMSKKKRWFLPFEFGSLIWVQRAGASGSLTSLKFFKF